MNKKELRHGYFLLAGLVDNLDVDIPDRNYLLELQQWFLDQLKEIEESNIGHITPCRSSHFHEIACLEDDERFGFFNSENDVRPGHAIWIEKKKAERIYEIIYNDIK